ncbi:MAG: hypothetical protein FWB95_03880 [Treponema sp.]|nr:hypothetical protein [Treponema sp.]
MKKLVLVIVIAALAASITLTSCASSGGGGSAEPKVDKYAMLPPPPGTERVRLANAALAMYKFTLPAGQTWGNYNKITAEYMVDEDNITKSLRSGAIRMYGNYKEEDFIPDSGNTVVSLSTDAMFAHKIIYQKNTNWAGLGAVANEWFTIEYDISGSSGHAQFKKENIPAANAAGPFYIALGLTSQDEGRVNAINQLIRNVTLHHRTDPTKNVVTMDGGFPGVTSASYMIGNIQRLGPQ